MGQALYRKYRPKKLGEIVGQEHITTTLSNAIASGSLSHAYLLTGPRGVGKTSIARILAHEINKIEYDESANHLDIIEIDAASNRRIEEIRELRDKVNVLPSQVEYKVYIIDEVHMLTREAFNALLKTLEEPPKHAIFILATTEAHKLPDTIISRTQHFTFKPIDENSLAGHLKTIASAESIDIDEPALQLIASHGDGSFRDSISLLDQIAGTESKITSDTIVQMLGLAPSKATNELIESLNNTTPKELIQSLFDLQERGVQATTLANQLAQDIRSKLIDDSNYQQQRYLDLLEELINISSSPKPDKQLEIVLLSFVLASNQDSGASKLVQEPQQQPKLTQDKPLNKQASSEKAGHAEKTEQKEKTGEKPEDKKEDKPKTSNSDIAEHKAKSPASDQPTIEFNAQAWPQILSALKKKYNTLYGVLKMADTDFEDNKLTLSFKFPFHKKKIDDQKNKAIISEIIESITANKPEVVVDLIIDKEQPKPASTKKSSHVSNVSDIFGGAELLES